MTFEQAINLGGSVARARKGASPSMPIRSRVPRPIPPAAKGADREIHYMKGYTVFNVEQSDRSAGSAAATHRPCRGILRATEASVLHGASKATNNLALNRPRPKRVTLAPYRPLSLFPLWRFDRFESAFVPRAGYECAAKGHTKISATT
jgi:hypothetical protein